MADSSEIVGVWEGGDLPVFAGCSNGTPESIQLVQDKH
jgi:hypothetical protein